MTALRVLLLWLALTAAAALGVALVIWVLAVLTVLAGKGAHP